MPTIIIPDSLLKFTRGQKELSFAATSTNVLIAQLKTDYPDLHQVIFDADGQLSGFINCYLNQQRLAHRLKEDQPLTTQDQLEIITAVSGG
jgi:molybdopterin converting factor small subunit